VVDAGRFEIEMGASSADTRVRGHVRVK
jgi:hypothetical protein